VLLVALINSCAACLFVMIFGPRPYVDDFDEGLLISEFLNLRKTSIFEFMHSFQRMDALVVLTSLPTSLLKYIEVQAVTYASEIW
jgi:hypothetical protein